jgi:hypothetical protein
VADAVIEVVHQQRDRHVQRGAALGGHVLSLGLAARLAEEDAGPIVARRTPAIGRMRFADIDADELCLVAVALLEIFEGTKLGPIGASGKAAED